MSSNTSTTTVLEAEDQLGYPDLHLLVNGERLTTAGRDSIPVLNPATSAVIGNLPVATEGDLSAAVEAAAFAFEKWRLMSAFDRSNILRGAASLMRARRERLARVLTLEQGKPLAESLSEVDGAANVFDWFAEEGRRAYGRIIPPRNRDVDLQVRRFPIGPCALFTPWNFPADLPSRKLAAALAAGCSVVIKPDEVTPAIALEIVAALHDAGLPPGVVNVVFGRPDVISQYLVSHPKIRKVSFTGSVPVGKHLGKLAAEHLKVITLELGGHSPVVVMDDVDIDRVTTLAAGAKFRNAGQICVSPNRFLVHERVYRQFANELARKAQGVQLGNGLNATTAMGPLAHARRLEAMESLVQDAVDCGATIAAGGTSVQGDGFFWKPTVILDVTTTSKVMNVEPFGPIAPVMPFSNLEEAIQEVNRLPFGLAAYAFTNNLRDARRLAGVCETGMLGINTFAIALPEAPFGGVKDSGHGIENGAEGLDSYLSTKFVAHSI